MAACPGFDSSAVRGRSTAGFGYQSTRFNSWQRYQICGGVVIMGAHRSCKPEARVRFSPPPPEFWSHGQAELTPACHAGSGSSTLPGTAKFDGGRSVQRFSTTACDAVRGSSNLLGYPKVCARGGTGIHTGLRNQLWGFESLRAHQIGEVGEWKSAGL